MFSLAITYTTQSWKIHYKNSYQYLRSAFDSIPFNFKLHMIIGNVNIYFASQCISIKRYFYVVVSMLKVATYNGLIKRKTDDEQLIL